MANVALDATGGEWQVVPVASAQRVVLFDGLDVDGDEWLLQTVAEALDEAEASALVTAGAIGDGTPLAALEAARAAHIEMYELRQPVRTRPTAWQPELARVITNAVLDGATVEHEGASWWDVSGAVVLDGVVGEASLTLALTPTLTTDPDRTKESAAINSSLMSLKQAVRSIARGAAWHVAAGGRHPLTQLLKPCFTHPAAHTLVLATVSPAAKDTEHSLNTLRHACVMDGRLGEGEAEKPWLMEGGGQVHKQPLGEIDIRATKERRQAEAEQLRARRPEPAASGGFGCSEREGMSGEAQAASDARRAAREEKATFARAERRAMRLLADASAEQQVRQLEERTSMES